MSGTSERIEIDEVDFQISCRRFTIRATITRDRQLPVVDEFVLRLLSVLDQMPVAKMRAWFGFTESEMQTVLVDMGRRSLVELIDDDLRLAPAGRELFRSVSRDGVPHIVEVAPLLESVWFDLVSRNMVPRSRARPTDYLVKVAEQPSAREMPEAFAMAAFEENFRDYARRIRRFPDPDAVNLYSISEVEGGVYGYQVLRAKLVLDLDRMKVRPIFSDLIDSPANYQTLTVAANDAWQLVSGPDNTAATAAEFERMTGDARFSPVITEPGSAEAWLEAFKLLATPIPGFKLTSGASYLGYNLEPVLAAISELKPSDDVCEIIWLRPSGSTWGRTQRVAEALVGIGDALRNAGRTKVGTVLAMPRSTSKGVRTNHKRLFGRGVLLPQGHLPANLEVLIVAGVVAVVNVHLPVGGHSVPIGSVVSDARRLARIVERLTSRKGEGWEELWRAVPSKPTDEDSGESYRTLDSA
ncbi:hypothetical protein [Rhizobium laguerreae]|uniref:hypothetical protein n=1 Tax=Rhizobium laguerreae TaxID=1076926 RepID=UPI001C929F04|nr:hypothetical protein [Rhizobium laguerreae]MBY3201770.1 hypothetical protein [Rhizobium laguerreae]